MIAPDGCGGKSLSAPSLLRAAFAVSSGFAAKIQRCGIFDQQNHGFVRPIIKRPYFGQSHAQLE
jgi:hypothetical protein